MKYVRKLIPVHPYDIPGTENWLEEQAARGLYLKEYGSLLCTFTRDTPRTVRYRLDYCDTDREPDPLPGLLTLYREMGWEYVCSTGLLLLFCTQDPYAPEPHTDPQTHAQLLRQMERKIKRSCSFLAWILAFSFVLSLIGVLGHGSLLTALALSDLTNIGLLFGFLSLMYLIPSLLDWRRVHRMIVHLEVGHALTPVPAASRWYGVRNASYLLCLTLLLCMFLARALLSLPQDLWSLGTEGRPGDFEPVLLTQWEGEDYHPNLIEHNGVTISNFCQLEMTLLFPIQWKVYQSGSIVKDQISVHMTLHWYRPILPFLDQPLARDLLDYQTVHEDTARRVDEAPLGPWAVTEHQVGGADYLATASSSNSEYQVAAAAGNGRAVILRYWGPQDLEDHLEEIAAMVAP